MIFQEKTKEKVLYTAEDQTIYDEYDKGYILKWLVTNSNEYDMEPLMLTLKPGASYKHFQPSNSDTFIYCLEGQITLSLGTNFIVQMQKTHFISGQMMSINYAITASRTLRY